MLFLGLGTGLGATLIIDGMVEPTEVGHMPLPARPHLRGLRRRARPRAARQPPLAQGGEQGNRRSASRVRSGLHRARRRQRAALEEAPARRTPRGQPPRLRRRPASVGPARRGDHLAGCGLASRPQAAMSDAPELPDSHRPGAAATRTWWLRARLLATVVHHRRRHHQRGLLSARRHPADPRSRFSRRRRRGFLGRSQAAVELHHSARAPGVPAVRIVHRHERFELTLRVVPVRAPRCAAHRGEPDRR